MQPVAQRSVRPIAQQASQLAAERAAANVDAAGNDLATLKTQLPKAKLIFSTTTPVPLGDGGGSRTEAHVQEYNAAALKALAPDIASGRVQINDLHGDIVSKCGAAYAKTGKCELQVPNGVHYEFAGRQYGALSVTRKILEVLWGLGLKKPPKPLKTDDGALKPNILLVMCVRLPPQLQLSGRLSH